MSEYTDGEIKCLCEWLRDNSSGIYRPCNAAADLIERMQKELHELKMEIASHYSKDTYNG